MRPARRYYSPGSPLKIFFALIFLVLVAVLAFRGLLLYKDSKFGKFDRFNVVLVTSPMTLVSVDLPGRTITQVIFPDDLYISDLAYGYGAYRASAIYLVGELDKHGGETAVDTVSDYLGIPVDGYIHSSLTLPKDIKNFFLSSQTFAGKSSLNLVDRVRLTWTVFQTRFDKVRVLDLAKFAEPLVLSDGSTALSLDKEVLDNRLQNDFNESRIREENLRLEIINSTKVVGLGNRAGRILVNAGANVVNVGSVEEVAPLCLVKATNKAKSSLTVARIVDVFSCQMGVLQDEGRAEVVMTLGQDYAKKLGN